MGILKRRKALQVKKVLQIDLEKIGCFLKFQLNCSVKYIHARFFNTLFANTKTAK